MPDGISPRRCADRASSAMVRERTGRRMKSCSSGVSLTCSLPHGQISLELRGCRAEDVMRNPLGSAGWAFAIGALVVGAAPASAAQTFSYVVEHPTYGNIGTYTDTIEQ